MSKYGMILGAIGAIVAMIAFPGSAVAKTDCGYATAQGTNSGPGPVVVYAGSGSSGQATAAAGACVDLGTGVNGFQGGLVEAGAKDTGQAYGVIDGDDNNTIGGSQSSGYAGVSNFETGGKDTTCDNNDTGSGSNSGGCLTLRPPDQAPVSVPVPLIICGNTTGPGWDASRRDGCSIP